MGKSYYNYDAFCKLIEKYKSITEADISNTLKSFDVLSEAVSPAIILNRMTGFMLKRTCTLCKAAENDCQRCLYDTYYYAYLPPFPTCREIGIARKTYDRINNANTEKELFHAIKGRVKYMEMVKRRFEIKYMGEK